MTNLEKRLDNVELIYNIVGGTAIGILVILTGVVIYLFICISRMKRDSDTKLRELDRLNRFTIKRPQMTVGDPNPVQNRFRQGDVNLSLFDSSIGSNQQQHQYVSQNVISDLNRHVDNNRPQHQTNDNNKPISDAAHNMRFPNQNNHQKNNNFLHRGSDIGGGPVFGQW